MQAYSVAALLAKPQSEMVDLAKSHQVINSWTLNSNIWLNDENAQSQEPKGAFDSRELCNSR